MNMRAIVILLLAVSVLGCQIGNSQSANAGVVPRPSGYIWTQLTEHAEFPESYNFSVFVVKDRMWMFHGDGVWSSTNGQTWTRSALPSMRKNVYQSDYVLFNDAVYALGDNTGNYQNIGFKPTIRRTTDFRRWETLSLRSNLPGRMFRGALVFDKKIWLLGGYDGKNYFNDVWNSSDGITWNLVTEHAAWSPRTVTHPFVFKDRMYIIGGGAIDGDTSTNATAREVWSTSDGKDWTKAPNEMPTIAGGTPVVYDDKLWLVGTNRDGIFGRSSMVSEDVTKWTEHQAPWSPRGGAATWVFNGKLYMTGGKYSVTENGQIRFIYSNDVWVMNKK